MGVLLARQHEMQFVVQEKLTSRLMTMQIISQHRHTASGKTLCMTLYPALDRFLLAILLVMTILRSDEFRLQREDFFFPWCTQHGGHHHVRVIGLILAHLHATIGTVDALRPEVLRTIQGEQACPAHTGMLIELSTLLQSSLYLPMDFSDLPRFHRIQQVADLSIARDL